MPGEGAYNRYMAPARHILLSIITVLGLLSALAWDGTSLACPSASVTASPMMPVNGCGHAPMPAKRRTGSHDGQICSSLCFGMLPPIARLEPHAPIAFAPLVLRLEPLFGIDPRLDPPPPRGV